MSPSPCKCSVWGAVSFGCYLWQTHSHTCKGLYVISFVGLFYFLWALITSCEMRGLISWATQGFLPVPPSPESTKVIGMAGEVGRYMWLVSVEFLALPLSQQESAVPP